MTNDALIAKRALRILGIDLKYDSGLAEYRVNFANGSEVTSYYTDSLRDAQDTGLAMANHRDSQKLS